MAFITSARQQSPPPAPADTESSVPLRKLTFPALGTNCEVHYAAPGGARQAEEFERRAVGWVQAFEAKYSRFRPDSLISRINAAAGLDWVGVDVEMEEMFKLCDTLHFMTQGILDPTVLPLMRLWDWKVERPSVPAAGEIDAARRLVGWTKVKRAPGRVFLPEKGMALDFGGFGKEYAVDCVAQIALECGLADALVDFGHDLRVLGRPPGKPAWHVGLEDPKNPGTIWSSIALQGNRGVASSGDYLRCFTIEGRRYGHIVDPRTGRPVANGCSQATVIAPNCLQAGVLSTTSFVLGVPKGVDFIQECPGTEGMLLMEKARAQTRGFYNYVVAK
jgi:thiamine biosynthesis lipoprotein